MARPFSPRAGRPRSRGQALVEVAIILPLFLLLLMTLLDFGRVIYAQNTITQDAREAVRRGIVSTAGLSGAAFQARFGEIRTAALTMAPAVPITGASIFGAAGSCSDVGAANGGMPAMPDDATVAGSCFYPNGTTNGDPDYPAKVVVNIQVTVSFMTPGFSFLFPDGITVTATAEQLIQS